MRTDLGRDFVYAVRTLGKNPGFSTVAVLAITLAIGANTTVYSVVDAFLRFPIPSDDPERTAFVQSENPSRGVSQGGTSMDDFLDWRESATSFDEVAAATQARYNLVGAGEPVRVLALRVSAGFFETFGIPLALGRGFRPEENEKGRDDVVVLSHALWQQRFSGARDALGRTLSLDGREHTVIGVAKEDFFFPSRSVLMWTPLVHEAGRFPRDQRVFFVLARLKEGVSSGEATTEMATIARRLEAEFPDTNEGWTARVETLRESFTSGTSFAVTLLYASITFVLLIACANVASLLLARATTREKEVALRTALGAGRLRLVRQLLTESVVLAGAGGLLGLGLGYGGMALLRRALAPDPNVGPITEFMGMNGTVLAHAIGVSLLAGLVFGLVPALQASRSDLKSVLKEGGRSAGSGSGRARIRSLLVVSEVALALTLLGTSGALIRAFTHLYGGDPGFVAENLLTFQLALPEADYAEPASVADFYRDALAELETLPGVRSAASTTTLPLTLFPGAPGARITVEGRIEEEGAEGSTAVELVVSESYFETMGVPIVEGRGFEARDDSGALPVAVVSREAAERYWPEGAVGSRFRMGRANAESPWLTIVGVSGDVQTHSHSLRRPNLRVPQVFLPMAQSPRRASAIAVRTLVEPASLSAPVREAVWSVDPRMPVDDLSPMLAVIGRIDTQNRIFLRVLTGLSAIALLLAAVGIYGIIAFAVNQRSHEIGIRMALGARPSSILALVVRQGAVLTLVGLAIGIFGAVALVRFMAGELEGITVANASGPLTFVVVSLVLLAVAQLASYLPARRAESSSRSARTSSEAGQEALVARAHARDPAPNFPLSEMRPEFVAIPLWIVGPALSLVAGNSRRTASTAPPHIATRNAARGARARPTKRVSGRLGKEPRWRRVKGRPEKGTGATSDSPARRERSGSRGPPRRPAEAPGIPSTEVARRAPPATAWVGRTRARAASARR
jgi:putative ABC transport system permease protein